MNYLCHTLGFPALNLIPLFILNSTAFTHSPSPRTHQDEWGSVFLEVPAGTKDSIATTAITNLMSHFNIPHWDVAKIDVEGAEAKVFGADADLSWMTKTKALIAELHHNYANDYFGEGNVHGLVRNAAKGQGMREIDSDHEHVVFEQAS